MKRFFDENEDNMPDDLFSNSDEYGDDEAYPRDDIERAIALDHKDLNQKILFKTIKMLERTDEKWESRTLNSKMKLIQKTYRELLTLIEDSE